MKTILYVGDNSIGNVQVTSAEMNMKLERYGLEVMHFKSFEKVMPYLNADFVKMVIFNIRGFGDLVAVREQIEKVNKKSNGAIPIVVLTENDNPWFRQDYIDMSYVYFIQFSDCGTTLKRNFETLLTEIEYRDQMRKLKFAVLDDDKLQLHALYRLFEKHGIRNVNYFNHPDEFEESDEEYDIYLVDLIMPGKSGEEVIFETHKKYPDAMVLAVSSLEKTDVIARVLSLGANDYIVKPYNETIFMAKIMSSARLKSLMNANRKKAEALEEIVVRDPLTNLYNQRQIEVTLTEQIKMNDKGLSAFSVIMMDLDKFKAINDTYGHIVGDEVLRKVANVIDKCIGTKGISGRYGGEEFIVILPGIQEAEAFFIAETVRRQVEKLSLPQDIRVTLSLGVAEFKTNDDNVIEKADKMLYEAKRRGRNRVVCTNHLC